MNSTLADAIAAGLAELDRVVDPPTEGVAFGSDLWCESDVRTDMLEIDGDDPLVLAQALVRRLDCPRGALPDDRDYGISLRDMLSAGVSTADLPTLEGTIRNELAKDDRVESLDVVVTIVSLEELSIRISVRPVDPSTTSFAMTLGLTSSALVLQEISQ